VVLVGITFLDWNVVEALGFGVVTLVPCESRTVGSGEESWARLTVGWKIEGAWCNEWFSTGVALEIGLSRDAATEWDFERSGFGVWVTTGGALGSVRSHAKEGGGSLSGAWTIDGFYVSADVAFVGALVGFMFNELEGVLEVSECEV